MKSPPRILFLGMPGRFSLPSLRALLESGIEVCAVAIPAANDAGAGRLALYRRAQARPVRPTLPMLNAPLESSIVQLAWERNIPVWEVADLSDRSTVATFATYQPDMVCVACFSQRIPRVFLEIPRLGCLNVHPSLLPANRGPVPLFWTFKEGSERTGVTIHLMDESMDGGDMLAQEVIQVSSGMSYAQLELVCASRGGYLLTQTVWKLYEGDVIPTSQDETRSSYHGFPRDEDFVVPVAEWDAAHVYNFICGVGDWSRPVVLQIGHEHMVVQKAISYSHGDISEASSKQYFWRDDELWVRCKAGWVVVVSSIAQ